MSVNENWSAEYGGQLVIGSDPHIPESGDAIVFETVGQQHEVLPVACGNRKTLALFAWVVDRDCEGTTSAQFTGA